ncbi:MAG TPA: hypothetical protein VN671_08950 [Solirubrobacterales bacterium]|nr:hypothetical protein [Solirubrobacterales bacterium]
METGRSGDGSGGRVGGRTRSSDPDDRRAKLVVPTERGLDEMKRADAIARGIERRFAGRIGKEALDRMKSSMAEIADP